MDSYTLWQVVFKQIIDLRASWWKWEAPAYGDSNANDKARELQTPLHWRDKNYLIITASRHLSYFKNDLNFDWTRQLGGGVCNCPLIQTWQDVWISSWISLFPLSWLNLVPWRMPIRSIIHNISTKLVNSRAPPRLYFPLICWLLWYCSA